MKTRLHVLVLAVGLIAAILSLAGWRSAQAEKLDGPKLKSMLDQLGYEVKTLDDTKGEEQYEFVIDRDGLKVSIAAEISPSTNYVWMTVLFSSLPQIKGSAEDLLKANGKIQPSQFYVTEQGRLKMAIALDNRNITNAFFKTKAEKLWKDVSDTENTWAKK